MLRETGLISMNDLEENDMYEIPYASGTRESNV